MFNVQKVPDDGIATVWPDVKEWFDEAISYGNGRVSEVSTIVDLARGNETLWLVVAESGKLVGAFTIRINQYPLRRMASVQFAGGEGLEDWWLDAITAIIEYADEMDCDGIEAWGRDGWWHYAKRLGFTRRSVFELNL